MNIYPSKRALSNLLNKNIDDLYIDSYYMDYYNNLNSSKIDKEFNRDVQLLVRSLKRIPTSERKAFINVLSSVIEFYVEKKIEKEIDESITKLLSL